MYAVRLKHCESGTANGADLDGLGQDHAGGVSCAENAAGDYSEAPRVHGRVCNHGRSGSIRNDNFWSCITYRWDPWLNDLICLDGHGAAAELPGSRVFEEDQRVWSDVAVHVATLVQLHDAACDTAQHRHLDRI